jgi:hypothetical protein
MSMVVHIQTVVQSTFAIVSDDGEIAETRTVTAVVTKLAESEFRAALTNICAAREELKLDLAKGSG